MSKKLLTFGIFIATLTIALVPIYTAYAQEGPLPQPVADAVVGIMRLFAGDSVGNVFSDLLGGFFSPLFKGIGYVAMTISGLALTMVGMLFDATIKYTIFDMGKNLSDSQGIGGSIGIAWATLRDVANMVFIFVLLYAAFKAMFDTNFSGFGKTVKDIIIIALLINFSLFLSKVVIDASNVVAVGFYQSISSTPTSLEVSSASGSGLSSTGEFKGISAGYMNLLGLQSWYSTNILTDKEMSATQIITVGLMSSAFFLVATVIFLITAVMFVARYILLIFIMILSPLAFIAYIIPKQSSWFQKWLDALINQSFFAPLFFALTWVVFKLASNPNFLGALKDNTTGRNNYVDMVTQFNPSTGALILNYVLVIGLSIAALIISKSMASKTMGFKALGGGIGAATIGGAALVGRKFVGGSMSAAANSGWLKDKALEGKYGSKYLAKAGLWAADKGSRASFDVRGLANTKAGKAVGAGSILGIAGKAGGEGGYKKWADKKKDARVKADKELYGQTEEEKTKAKELEKDYNLEKFRTEEIIKKGRREEAERLVASTTGAEQEKARARLDYINKHLNKKNIFDKDDYSKYAPDWNKSDIKLNYERYAQAGERRMEARAKETENKFKNKGGAVAKSVAGGVIGGMVAGPLGAAIGTVMGAGIGEAGMRFKKSLANKMRAETKKPSKEKALADAYKAIADSETPEPETPTTPPGGAPSGGAPSGGAPGGGGGATT